MGDVIFLSRDDLSYVLDGLSHRENKHHFEQSLAKAVAAGPRLTPLLLLWLDQVLADPKAAAQFGNPLKTTAILFILAARQERSAFAPLVRLMQLSDPNCYDLLEEEAVDSSSRILAALAEPIDLMVLAADQSQPLVLREACVDGLLLHFAQDLLGFDELADFLFTQWSNLSESDYEYWRTCLLTSYYIADEGRYSAIKLLAPRIKESYRRDLLHMLKLNNPIDAGLIRSNLFASPEFQVISDPVLELKDMQIFELVDADDLGCHHEEDDLDPESSYTFVLKTKQASGFSCSIELLDDHDLHDLHLAIQDGLNLAAGQAYSFFFGEDLDSTELAYEGSPEGSNDTQLQLANFDFYEGQEFSYQFKQGPEHRFTLRVSSIKPLGDRDPLGFVPVIKSQGIRSVQFSSPPILT